MIRTGEITSGKSKKASLRATFIRTVVSYGICLLKEWGLGFIYQLYWLSIFYSLVFVCIFILFLFYSCRRGFGAFGRRMWLRELISIPRLGWQGTFPCLGENTFSCRAPGRRKLNKTQQWLICRGLCPPTLMGHYLSGYSLLLNFLFPGKKRLLFSDSSGEIQQSEDCKEGRNFYFHPEGRTFMWLVLPN